MDRRQFIKSGCTACISIIAASTVLSSCSAIHYTSGKMGKDGMFVDLNEFVQKGNGKFRPYIIVRNEDLLFPICIFRLSETEYSALWMECAHQGAELNVAGDHLHCPAHGSEYDNNGLVTNGPAERNLRRFPVQVNNNELFIDLRKA